MYKNWLVRVEDLKQFVMVAYKDKISEVAVLLGVTQSRMTGYLFSPIAQW